MRSPWPLPLLLLLTLAVYLSLTQAEFVWDDRWLFLSHPTFPREGLLELLSRPLWHGVAVSGEMPYFRPLLLASAWLDRELFGFQPQGWHLHSLLWHLLAVALLYRLLRRLLPGTQTAVLEGRLLALVGALVFALHPIQSEVVAWIAARNDSMATVFVLLMLLSLLPERGLPSWRRCGVAGVCYALALLSKENALLTPVVALGLLRWRPPEAGGEQRPTEEVVRPGLRALFPVGLALTGGLLSVVLLRSWIAPPVEGMWTLQAFEVFLGRLPTILGTYGRLLLWPWPLAVGRDLRDLPVGLSLERLLGIVALLSLWGLPWLQPDGWRRRLAWAGAWGVAVTLLPAMWGVMTTSLVGERYLYLPLVFLSMAVAALVPERRAVLWGMAAVTLVWVLILGQRLPDWQSDHALFQADALRLPACGTQLRYARVLLGRRQAADALSVLEQGALGDPQCSTARLAAILAGVVQGKPEVVALHLQPVLLQPVLLESVMEAPEQAGMVALGLVSLGREGEALSWAQRVVQRERGTFAEVVLVVARLREWQHAQESLPELDPSGAWMEAERDAFRLRLLADVPQPRKVVTWTAHILRMRGDEGGLAWLARLGEPLNAPLPMLTW